MSLGISTLGDDGGPRTSTLGDCGGPENSFLVTVGTLEARALELVELVEVLET